MYVLLVLAYFLFLTCSKFAFAALFLVCLIDSFRPRRWIGDKLSGWVFSGGVAAAFVLLLCAATLRFCC
jgi:uncharacterized membrane protein YraQ (UPF0718 family)